MSVAASASARPRVVVADDSALMRKLVGDVLTRGGFDVVATARDGDEALTECRRQRPDALTLDLSMPGMGGIEVLRALRGESLDLPVVVVSAFSPAQGAYAVDALAEGAFELVTKPTSPADAPVFEQMLLGRVTLAVTSRRQAAALRLASGGRTLTPPWAHPAATGVAAPAPVRRTVSRDAKVVLIAISTGGPKALAALLPELPSPLGLGTMIVQHMPAGFTASLANRLNRASRLTVREAAGAEALDPGVALLAPGGKHLRMDDTGRTLLSDEEPVGGLRPRADLTIEDAARRHGERLVLVVMTGMGQDGLRGAQAVRRHGGRVIAEAEETCTVYGMPRAIAEAGLADRVEPLHALADAIAEEAGA
ncbi:MAG TPA: chemotaxis-specific protein-glutamate methyltransferase CheB [Solirubrobacteraceae bacterium]|nr:chemotaxis-specific protein-glutamate methyltransferase CheB [Solirubrobacteraceae bacterium]